MRPEDLAAGPGIPQILLLVLCAIVCGASLGLTAAALVANSGRWGVRSSLSRRRMIIAGRAVLAAASISATGWLIATTIADIDTAQRENVGAVTSWAAEYGVTVEEDQAVDIASVVFSGVNDTVYRVTGPAGEITVRLEEAGGEYSLSQELGLAPLERVHERPQS